MQNYKKTNDDTETKIYKNISLISLNLYTKMVNIESKLNKKIETVMRVIQK